LGLPKLTDITSGEFSVITPWMVNGPGIKTGLDRPMCEKYLVAKSSHLHLPENMLIQ